MIRNIKFAGELQSRLVPRMVSPRIMLRSSISTLIPSQSLLKRSQRYYSEPVAAKTFKSSSFALPKERPGENSSKNSENSEILIDVNDSRSDFDKTKLIRGSTDLKIAITDRATQKLITIAEGDRKNDTALKVKVESGGCHGFQYNFELTSLSEELSKDDDLVVFQRDDTDLATVLFDESSLEILQDSKLDYTNELIGSSFQMVDSPYTSTSCGCGASFDFDFDKLEKAKGE